MEATTSEPPLVETTLCSTHVCGYVCPRLFIIFIASIHSYLYPYLCMYIFIRLNYMILSTCYLQFLVTVATLGVVFDVLGLCLPFFPTTGAGDMQNTVRFSSYFDTLHAIRRSCYSDNVYTLQKMQLLNIINFFDIENNILFE